MPVDSPGAEATSEQPRLLPASLEDRLVNWIGRIGGAALLLAITLTWLSLITWSVTDPSLTHATSGKAQNGLGAIGAIVSDLLLQMLGLASALALLAPMLWALELMASDRVPGFRTKASFYPLSVLVLAGALSALPVTQGWPLHHGLGGILGDLLHGVGVGIFAVINPERASAATGFVLFVVGFSALGYSIGLDMKDLSGLLERSFARPAPKAAKADASGSDPAGDDTGTAAKAASAAGGGWFAGLFSRRRNTPAVDETNRAAAGDGSTPNDQAPATHHAIEPSLGGLGEYDDRGWWHQSQAPQQHGWVSHGGHAAYPAGEAGYGADAAFGAAAHGQQPAYAEAYGHAVPAGHPAHPYAQQPAAPHAYAAPPYGQHPAQPYAGHPQPALPPGYTPPGPYAHAPAQHVQEWAHRDWSQPMAVAPIVPHLGPHGGEGGLAHAPAPHAPAKSALANTAHLGERREPALPGLAPPPAAAPSPAAYNPYAGAIPLPVRAPRAPEPTLDPAFESQTEAASRGIAERFAPGGGAPAPRPARAPGPPPPPEPARKGSGLLAGFGFRRAEPGFKRPPLNMLKRAAAARPGSELTQTVLRGNARLLEDVLADFGVKGEVRDIKPGPVVTLFEVEPARGTKSSRVIGLADDIARSMSANAVRVAVVPGRNAIGIELPNARRESVLLRELLETDSFRSGDNILPLALGKSIGGEPVVADLARMPHLLVAGTTGSGKSVGINAFVLSLLYRHAPEDCRLLMIDPKMLELSVYNGIPHLLTPVVTDPQKAVAALNWAVGEMEERYKRMAKLSVRNIDVYNNRVRNAKKRGELIQRSVQTGFDKRGQAVYENEELDLEPMPYIVIVVDEFADLMIVAGKEIEGAVQRLAQMARAAGIHLVMATQRPSVDIITGTIKANFPTRISFKVASKIDSRTILNDQGAEQLLGQGDMLFSTGSGQAVRVHGPFVSDEEVEAIARFLREQGVPRYIDGITEPAQQPGGQPASADGRATSDDDLYDRAVAVVLRDRKPSTSYVQRRLSIGYNRAADLIERMEREGLISPPNGTGRREILAVASGADDAA